MGQVEFFKGIIEQAGLDSETEDEIRSLIERKNMLELEILLKSINILPAIKEIIYDMPKLYGNGDMLLAAAKISNNEKCDKAIENIRSVHKILKAFGYDSFLSFDLGMVQTFNFYTGIIFRGITSDLGYPICGGGRYDRLVQEFGVDMPATGFAIGIKRLLMVLERQNSLQQIPPVDVLVAYEQNQVDRAYGLVRELREQGKRTEVFVSSDVAISPEAYALKKRINEIVYVSGSGVTSDILIKKE